MLRNVQALVVLVLGLIPLCKSQHPSSELVAVWKRLSWKSVWLLDINSTGRLDAAPHWVKRASQEGISCTLLFHSDLPRLSHSDAVVVTSVREEVMDDVLALAAWRPHQVMVVDTGEWDSLPEHLEKVQLSTSFFYMRIARGQLLSSLWMLLTWKRQRILVKNEWKLDSTTNGYVPSYDMQGIELTSLTPPWPPWMTNFECQPDNSRCKTEGILTDLMEELQSQMNFTLRVDQNSVWGSVPKEGTFREGNAVFEGAMGAIVSNDYDVGLSAWGIRLDRSAYLDYSMTLPDHAVVAVNWDLLGTDLVMLLRPFTLESWIGIGVALVTVLLFLLVSRRTYGRIESSWQLAIGVDKDYYKVAEVSGWLFFLLVNAYYSGALTMFFSSSPRLPFNTLREALALYPDWRMVIMSGDEVFIQPMAEELHDPLFIDIWRDAQLPGQEIIQPDAEATINKLSDPGHYVYMEESSFLYAYRSPNRHHNLKLEIVYRQWRPSGIIFHKNSPLTDMCNKGIVPTALQK